MKERKMSREKVTKVIEGEINYYLELYRTGLECHDEECLCRVSLAKIDYIPYFVEKLGIITEEEMRELIKENQVKKKKIMEEFKNESRRI